MAYYLFRHKGWAPMDYYGRTAGERLVLAAFVTQELEDRAEHPAPACPLMRIGR